MIETEIRSLKQNIEQIPSHIRSSFMLKKDLVSTQRSLIPWGEHCTECVWPVCYSSCGLYIPRSDKKCRLFLNGIEVIPFKESINGYLLKIGFKKWGKLWANGFNRLYSIKTARFLENINSLFANFLRLPFMPEFIRIFIAAKYNILKNRYFNWRKSKKILPTHFVFECYNPNDFPISATLSIRSQSKDDPSCFQKLATLVAGYNRVNIKCDEIRRNINLCDPIQLDFTLNDINDGTTIIFGFFDFIKNKESISNKIKCIVWDLDNTLWDGILIENGIDSIVLKDKIKNIIIELDKRGILLSIASKNNEYDALMALEKTGLRDYFLFPQISWEPKSRSIEQIANQLNIGLNSFLFIDDQVFEREEVLSSLPMVRVMDAMDYASLLSLPELQTPVTEESSQRRLLYQQHIQRKKNEADFNGNYSDFLKSCKLKMSINTLKAENIERVYELAQRTNQMNFSGNRYSKTELETIIINPSFDTYVIKCEDRFGNYGIVGFCILNKVEPRIIDLMFSCRIQSKRVEHAFLGYLIQKYRKFGKETIYADYKRSEKNAQSGRVFFEIGFEEEKTENGVTSLIFKKSKEIPNDHIISMSEST